MFLVLLGFAGNSYCQRQSIAVRNRMQSDLFMRTAALKSALKKDPAQFFRDHIEERYTSHDGVRPLVLISFCVSQIIDSSTILARTSHDQLYAIRRINTNDLRDDQWINLILIPDGTYEYVTVLGVKKRISACIPGNTMQEADFMRLHKAGFDFVSLVLNAEKK